MRGLGMLWIGLLLSVSCATEAVEAPTPGESSDSSTSVANDWVVLFNGRDLEGWKATGKPEAFSVQDGTLYCDGSGGRLLYYEPEKFQDFVLEAEVKVSEGANSGIFFRVADPADLVQTGIEMQVLDSYGKREVGTHDFGAIYDVQAPRVNAARPAGEWNQVRITCQGPRIQVDLNGTQVVDMDLSRWTEPGMNPDGTKNKFQRAYREMVHAGYIGLQDHGKPVWFRNLRVQRLH